MLYADVIIDISHEAIDRSFQYIVGEPFVSVIKEGSLVFVPFGNGNRLKKGYCIGLSTAAKIAPEKLKQIHSVESDDISIEGQLMSLAMWIARTYGATMASALRSVLPVSKKAGLREKRTICLAVSEEEAVDFLNALVSRKGYSHAKEKLIRELILEGELPWEVVTAKLNVSAAHIRDLKNKGVLDVISKETHYVPRQMSGLNTGNVSLNSEQQHCVDTFVSDYESGKTGTYLIHGITGSGKTEVYIRMIDHIIKSGKSAIVLIPEIALTYQTLMRFYHSFGDMVSVMNSRLTDAEKYDIAKRARDGEIRIIIGPRSALFTPFPDLGIIIMDEEHETSYKSEKMPRYHARETAIERARLAGASVVLGSATPSVESYCRAEAGEFTLLKLTQRASAANLASCEIIDLREELRSGNRSILSRRLSELIRKALDDKKQVMLFINRRGMLSSISCRECGEVIKCPHCDVSLSLHKDGRLHCHYCGFTKPAPKTCPSCNSPHIGGFKAGTEKIEKYVADTFLDARVIRMDADSTKGKDGHERILSAFANREADILIGTQMIVKGHDFPDVSLVGILAADMSLNDTDFRSSERTFDLITQAAGRAGRAGIPGHVIIQTYRPDSYAITLAAAQDYEAFYKKEISYRRLMKYPPASHLLLVMLLSKKEEEAERLSSHIEESLSRLYPDLWISRAARPSITKIKDIHRRMIYLKTADHTLIATLRNQIEKLAEPNDSVSIYFDLDPLSFF